MLRVPGDGSDSVGSILRVASVHGCHRGSGRRRALVAWMQDVIRENTDDDDHDEAENEHDDVLGCPLVDRAHLDLVSLYLSNDFAIE